MDIVIAIALLGGLGLIFGLVLAAASKVFYVETDPRLEKLNDCLPCANCGGCGYAGCSSYAEAVLKGEATIDKCASGGNEAAQAMAAIMGVEAVDVERKVALVRCSGARSYDKDGGRVTCTFTLSGARDAYEFSLVAVPAQRAAGVSKSYTGEIAYAEKEAQAPEAPAAPETDNDAEKAAELAIRARLAAVRVKNH